jgi:uncharacterized repeat protein (TIGR03803 family)
MFAHFFPRRFRLLAILAVILMLAATSWPATDRLLYSFHPFQEGFWPCPNLVSDSEGNLYGCTDYGGQYGGGTVFELRHRPDGSWKEETLYSFGGYPKDAGHPLSLTFGPDSNLYGISEDGPGESGAIFQLARGQNGHWRDAILYNFASYRDGATNLVLDAQGNIYSASEEGGPNNDAGYIYKLRRSAPVWTEEVLYSFCHVGDCEDGSNPDYLTLGKDGAIYGSTYSGGPYGRGGVVFKLTDDGPGAWNERVIYAFGGQMDGYEPGGVTFDEHGNLYGTTAYGGRNHAGIAYELTPANSGMWTETILYSFYAGVDGYSPSGLAVDSSGNLYGTTLNGGVSGYGTVFSLSPGSSGAWTETVLHNFSNDGHGTSPGGTPIVDSSGNVYSTTDGGYDEWTVFELSAENGQWEYRVLEGFRAGDGEAPIAPPVLAAGGRMYSMTNGYGAYGYGTVFELRPGEHGKHKETVIHNFNGTDGSYPQSGLILDQNGNLYGTTPNSGALGTCGVAFELSQAANGGWQETVLHSFSGSDGCLPQAGLVFDSAGNLYGTTYEGGTDDQGSVFELSPGSNGVWTETVLYSFTGGNDGGNPAAGLIFDGGGNLYGTAFYGGGGPCSNGYQAGCGDVFELSPTSSGWSLSVLYNFSGTNDGNNPAATLTFDHNGNLYGTTEYGGNSGCCGTAFELSPASGGWIESNLYSFTGGADGVDPICQLVLDAQGNIYGATPWYRNSGNGSVFELIPLSGGGWSEKTLYDFDTDHNVDAVRDGSDPGGGVVFDGAGHLIGVTAGGGEFDAGTVFELTP